MEKKFNIRKFTSPVINILSELTDRYLNRFNHLIICHNETGSENKMISLNCKLIHENISHSTASEKNVLFINSDCINDCKYLIALNYKISLLLSHFHVIPATDMLQLIESRKILTDSRRKITDSHRNITDSRRKITDSRRKITDSHRNITDSRRKITDSRREVTDSRKTFRIVCKLLKTCREILKSFGEVFRICPAILTGSPGQLTGSRESITEICVLNLISPDNYIECRKQLTASRVVFRIFPVFYRTNPVKHGD